MVIFHCYVSSPEAKRWIKPFPNLFDTPGWYTNSVRFVCFRSTPRVVDPHVGMMNCRHILNQKQNFRLNILKQLWNCLNIVGPWISLIIETWFHVNSIHLVRHFPWFTLVFHIFPGFSNNLPDFPIFPAIFPWFLGVILRAQRRQVVSGSLLAADAWWGA